jgi:hypothetical protein
MSPHLALGGILLGVAAATPPEEPLENRDLHANSIPTQEPIKSAGYVGSRFRPLHQLRLPVAVASGAAAVTSKVENAQDPAAHQRWVRDVQPDKRPQDLTHACPTRRAGSLRRFALPATESPARSTDRDAHAFVLERAKQNEQVRGMSSTAHPAAARRSPSACIAARTASAGARYTDNPRCPASSPCA